MDVFDKITEVFGTSANLARDLGISPYAIYKWKRRGNIPARYCNRIADASGGQITLNELNPEVYPLKKIA